MGRKYKPRFTVVDLGKLEDSLRMIFTQLGALREATATEITPQRRGHFQRGVNTVRLDIHNALSLLEDARKRVRSGPMRATAKPGPKLIGYDLDSVLEALPVGGIWYVEGETVEDMHKIQVRVKNRQRHNELLENLNFKTSTCVAVGAPIGNVRYLVRVERLDELLDRQEREAEGAAGSP